MAISKAKTSTASVLLKESVILETSLVRGKLAELGKANLLFWQRITEARS